ncbi:MAG: WD40 repeat domain-containing protein [Treponema sp.]|nr:WD40 repeat domain-containing protein [Treponema sp.]
MHFNKVALSKLKFCKCLLKHFFLVGLFFIVLPVFSANISGSHRGEITALVHNEEIVLSAGEDGFLVQWNTAQRTAIDRFQLTTYRIQSMVKHPTRTEISIIEAVNFDNYRISAWDYSLKERLFSIYSTRPVRYINYSAQGNLLIAAGLDGFPLTILDSATGEVVLDAVIQEGTATLAVTGRAESNMMIYMSEYSDHFGHPSFSGSLLYFDIQSNTVTNIFQAPGFIENPVFFGNIFLAGVNQDGLQIVNTTSGQVLDNIETIGRNALICLSSDGFFLFEQTGSTALLYRFTVDGNGQLNQRQRLPIVLTGLGTVTSMAYNGSLVFGTSQGNLLILDRQNRIVPFRYNFHRRITEIAAGEQNIGFLTEDGFFSYIPLDYSSIGSSFQLNFTEVNNFNRITSVSLEGKDFFILWQTDNTRIAPQLIDLSNNKRRNLNFLTGRFPLRTIDVLDGRFLTMDTVGNIYIYNLEVLQNTPPAGSAEFSFSSMGAIDAVLIGNYNILISRSVMGVNSPFLSVNLRTGETVPMFFPAAQAGLMVYRGSSSLFAAAVELSNNNLNTVFLNISATGQHHRLFNYSGEANHFSIAEVQNHLAIICGSDGGRIVLPEMIEFERTSGLPVRLLASRESFIGLDSEGNIAWHNLDGRLLARFQIAR